MMKILLICAMISSTFGCTFEGLQKQNEETWVVRNNFIMKCIINKDQSWRTEVTTCRSPRGVPIPIGESVTEDGMKFSCRRNDAGRITYHREMDPFTFCDGHQLGDTWIVNKNFNRSCTEKGSFILNCLTDSGARIELNGQVIELGTLYKCTQEADGSVILHRSAAPVQKVDPIKLAFFKNKDIVPQLPFDPVTTTATTTVATEEAVTTANLAVNTTTPENNEFEFTEAATPTLPPPTESTTEAETTQETSTSPEPVPQQEEVTQIHPVEPNPPVPLPVNDLPTETSTGPLPPAIRPTEPEGPVGPPQQLVVSASGILHEQEFVTDNVQPVTSQPIHIVHPPSIRPPPGMARIQNGVIECVEDGIVRMPEETWIVDEKFLKTCTHNGGIVVLECLVDEKTSMKVNTNLQIGDRLHRCWRQGDQVFYEVKDVARRRF